jgi:hypothetical protein
MHVGQREGEAVSVRRSLSIGIRPHSSVAHVVENLRRCEDDIQRVKTNEHCIFSTVHSTSVRVSS